MAKTPIYDKDPASVLDYKFDWEDWLGSDTITGTPTATVEAISGDASPLAAVTPLEKDTTSATAWLSGGTVGNSYTVTVEIVTTGGRTDQRSIEIRVVER